MAGPVNPGIFTVRSLRKAVEMLRSNPRLLVRRIGELSTTKTSVPAPAPQDRISRSVDDVVAALRAEAPSKLVAYGDSPLVATITSALPSSVVTWVSHDAADLLAGAIALADAPLSSVDAIVVGGPDVGTGWSSLLRELLDCPAVPALHWVGSNWEFCGSQIPLPAEAEGADIFLFNHFPDYFQVKDPLLVRIDAADANSTLHTSRIVRPHESLRLALSDLLPDRSGPPVVDVRCEHPTLTRGRHHRWRVCVDVHWKGSFTTLHGGHDYGAAHAVESRRPSSDLRRGEVAVVLPNPTIGPGVADVQLTSPADRRSAQVSLDRPVNQISFPPAATLGIEAGRGVYGYSYRGSGTPFWFSLGETPAGRPTIAANHELSVRVREDPLGLSSSARETYAALENLGFLLHPHALPLLPMDSPVEFGFTFRAANPAITVFRGWLFDPSGQRLESITFDVDQEQPVFPAELAGTIADRPDPGLLVFGPDWARAGADPSLISFGGDLVVRSRTTADIDITEFQSCWRNLGVKIEKFPHWIHPSNAVAGRTNVLARVRTGDGIRTAIAVANASGSLRYNRPANVRVRVFDPNGRSGSGEARLQPFSAELLWCDELVDDLDVLLPNGYGAVHVTSQDADLNCQLVTLSANGSVSLQHLWGY